MEKQILTTDACLTYKDVDGKIFIEGGPIPKGSEIVQQESEPAEGEVFRFRYTTSESGDDYAEMEVAVLGVY